MKRSRQDPESKLMSKSSSDKDNQMENLYCTRMAKDQRKRKNGHQKTRFEEFPNELMLEIFLYLASIDRCLAFAGLNNRFNALLLSGDHQLNLCTIHKVNFDYLLSEVLPFMAEKLTELRLASDQCTRSEMRHLFCSFTRLKFPRLRILFIRIMRDQDLTRLMKQLPKISQQLVSLTVEKAKQHCNPELNLSPLLQMCLLTSFPCLQHLALPKDTEVQSFFSQATLSSPNSSLSFSLLHHLSIFCSLTNLLFLLGHLPKLETLLYKMARGVIEGETPLILPLLPHLVNFSFEEETFDQGVHFDTVSYFLNAMPQLRTFSFYATAGSFESSHHYFLDGYRWESVLEQRSSLIEFKLRLTIEIQPYDCIDPDDPETGPFDVEDILERFRSDFWLQEKKWFLQYILLNDIIHLGTVPFARSTLEVYFDEPPVIGTTALCGMLPSSPFDWVDNLCLDLDYTGYGPPSRKIFDNLFGNARTLTLIDWYTEVHDLAQRIVDFSKVRHLNLITSTTIVFDRSSFDNIVHSFPHLIQLSLCNKDLITLLDNDHLQDRSPNKIKELYVQYGGDCRTLAAADRRHFARLFPYLEHLRLESATDDIALITALLSRRRGGKHLSSCELRFDQETAFYLEEWLRVNSSKSIVMKSTTDNIYRFWM